MLCLHDGVTLARRQPRLPLRRRILLHYLVQMVFQRLRLRLLMVRCVRVIERRASTTSSATSS